jgi:hypothetical protein
MKGESVNGNEPLIPLLQSTVTDFSHYDGVSCHCCHRYIIVLVLKLS